MNPALIRQYDLIPEASLGENITVIGAGAVGSWTVLALAKMGFGNIRVFDHDSVSMENMNSQMYPLDMIGVPKVKALSHLVHYFTGVQLITHQEKWETQIYPGIVIGAVDSMTVRRQIYVNYKKSGYRTRAVIDPRMGAENALLYTYKPMDATDCQAYEKSLYAEEEALAEPCTGKATIYTANLLSGLVCKAVKDQIVKRPNYLRTAQWDIGNNELLCFQAKQG